MGESGIDADPAGAEVVDQSDAAPEILAEALQVEDGKRFWGIECRGQQDGDLLRDRAALAFGAGFQPGVQHVGWFFDVEGGHSGFLRNSSETEGAVGRVKTRLPAQATVDIFYKMQNSPSPADPTTLPFRTKRELAIGTLRDAIQTGRYQPGQSLRQTQLMADLGMGSTPVREAMLELLARGVLVQESHHSVRIADLDLPRLREIYQVRCLLEAEAARLGTATLSAAGLEAMRAQVRRMEAGATADDAAEAARADIAFRRTLYAAAGNAFLLDLIDQAWMRFPAYILYGIPGRLAQSIAEHHQIVEAVARRDADAAGLCVRRHLLGALDVLETYVAQFGPHTNVSVTT